MLTGGLTLTRSHFVGITAGMLAMFATACSHPGHEANAFRWTSQLPAGSVVHIRDGAGGITVHSATGTEAVVTGSRSWRRGRAHDVKFVVKQDGNDYYVCAMWRNSGNCGENGYRGRSTGGWLTIFSLFHRGSDATADIVVQLPPSVGLDARTSIGSVNVDGANAGVYAKTANGSVTATNVAGPLVLTTANGSVRLSALALAPTDSVRLTTANGSIHAELPAALDGEFDLRTTNGSVRSDFPLTPTSTRGGAPRHLAGQIGTSTRPVHMRTANGAVIVTTRPAAASSQ
jgi:hypothetical protein